MLEFRVASYGDEKLVHDFILKLAKYEKLEDEVCSDINLVKTNIFDNKYANCLIFNDGVNDIGFVIYFFNFSTFNIKPGLYIEDLYIDDEYRGLGYGSMVFDHIKTISKQKECGRIEWICLDWNKSAIDFYENKLGATSMDGWTIRRLVEEQF